MAKILIGQLGSAISPKIIPFVRPATKKDFIEARNAYASGWKFQQEYVESLLRGCKPVYRLPFDPSGGTVCRWWQKVTGWPFLWTKSPIFPEL